MPEATFISDAYYTTRVTTRNPKVNGRYVANSPYLHRWARTHTQTGYEKNGSLRMTTASSVGLFPDAMTISTNNRLYGKLLEALIPSKGELLTTAVEWRTSLDMISGRTRQIGAAFLAVRRFKFTKAAKILNISTPSRVKNLTAKRVKAQGLSVTSLWLEYWMGWAPLIGDVANAVQTMTKGPLYSERTFSVSARQESGSTSGNRTGATSGSYYHYDVKIVKRTVFSCYGKVRVTNHNANLATQLGFTNPLLTAWQVLPFSFMVDWFANVGTVLGSLTDFQNHDFYDTGSGMKHSAKAEYSEVEMVQESYYAYPNQWPPAKRLVLVTKRAQAAWLEERRRTPGAIPMPRLHIQMLDKLSLTRAATSVSLLVEIFLRKK